MLAFSCHHEERERARGTTIQHRPPREPNPTQPQPQAYPIQAMQPLLVLLGRQQSSLIVDNLLAAGPVAATTKEQWKYGRDWTPLPCGLQEATVCSLHPNN